MSLHHAPNLVADVLREPAIAARVIAELEHRVRALEAEIQRCESERDERAGACRDARDAQRKAEDSARVQDEILALVAHDLRNPLGTIVMGATTLLHVDASADPDGQRGRNVAERIQRQAGRMAQQLRNLGDLVEIRTGRIALDRAPHAPRAILATASELLGPLVHERGIAFEARAAVDLPDVECDADRAVRALSNLVTNAMTRAPRGATIECDATLGDHQQIVFFVRDSGPGFGRDERAMLFRPVSPDQPPSYLRTWLGFAIARGIVDAHGGRIWVDSAPGTGTTVSFSLTPGD